MKTSIFLKNAHQALSYKVHIGVYNADQVNIQTHKTIINRTCSQWTQKDTGPWSLSISGAASGISFHRIWSHGSLYRGPQSCASCALSSRAQLRSEKPVLSWQILKPSTLKSLKTEIVQPHTQLVQSELKPYLTVYANVALGHSSVVLSMTWLPGLHLHAQENGLIFHYRNFPKTHWLFRTKYQQTIYV